MDFTELVVDVFSFGYTRSGIPYDVTGNGGGFVFDCRCLPNPGRYALFMHMTGRDSDVMRFLDTDPVVQNFLHGVFALTDLALQNYLDRGFYHLMISFGCTGGQHRSVYCADRLAEHLRIRGIRCSVTHCERKLWP